MEDIFAIRLKREREERGWQKQQAAKYLGLQNSTYGHYEKANRRPDYDTLLRIAEKYEVSVDYLLGKSHFKNGGGPQITAILDLTDDQIVKSVQFKVDSEPLTETQVRRLIAFVRAERSVVFAENGSE